MIQHVLFAAYLFAISAVFALLEVQIEGSDGWARQLPTWRVENAWTRRWLGARAITGYHLYIHAFVLLLAHTPFGLRIAPFSWHAEFRILAFLVLFWVLEDFLWFAVNPSFGLRNFRRERVWWHAQTWWGFMPRDYWIFTPMGIALYLLSLGA